MPRKADGTKPLDGAWLHYKGTALKPKFTLSWMKMKSKSQTNVCANLASVTQDNISSPAVYRRVLCGVSEMLHSHIPLPLQVLGT